MVLTFHHHGRPLLLNTRLSISSNAVELLILEFSLPRLERILSYRDAYNKFLLRPPPLAREIDRATRIMTFPWRDCANNRYAPRLGRVHGTRNEEVEVESGSKRVQRRPLVGPLFFNAEEGQCRFVPIARTRFAYQIRSSRSRSVL